MRKDPVEEWSGKTIDGLNWKVFNGDAASVLETRVAVDSVDCIVTSPPYYSQRDYGVEGQIGLEPSIESYVLNVTGALNAAWKVLKKSGTLFLNLGDTYYSAKGLPKGNDKKHRARRFGLRPVDGPGLGVPRKTIIGIPWRVALRLVEHGWVLRSPIIWQRSGAIPEPTAHDRPWRTYENIFMFSKSQKYYFDRSALRGLEDIWTIGARPRKEDRLHTAPFPDALVATCLDIACKPGGTVLDPFAGSGTTLRVAIEKKCSAIGIDLNAEFCRHAAIRLREMG